MKQPFMRADRRMTWHFVLFAAVLLPTNFAATTGVPSVPKRPSQYTAKHWSLGEGLTDTYVQALAQTPDGYLWIGTQNSGLVRFDGVRFTPIRPGFSAQADEASIRAMAVAPDGRLWIGTDGFGLWSCREGAYTRYGKNEGLPNENVRALLVDRSGSVWAAHAGGVVRRGERGDFQSIAYDASPARHPVYAMHQTADGTVWLAGDGLWSWHEGKMTNWSGAFGRARRQFLAICEDGAGGLWLAGKEGLWRHTTAGVEQLSERDGLSESWLRALKRDEDGTVWIGSIHGLDRMANGRIETLLTREGASYDLIYTIFQDREGSLWIGSNGGLTQLKDDAFALLTTTQGLSQNVVLAVIEARDESFWIGTWTKGVTRLEGSKATVYGKHQGLDSSGVRALHEGSDGAIWVGTDGGGLSRIAGGKVETWRPEGLNSETIIALESAEEPDLWAVTDKRRLYRGRGADWQSIELPQQDLVFTIHKGPSGRFWAATDRAIYWREQGADSGWREISLPAAALGKTIRSLTETSGGDLWVCGQNAGLLRLRGGEFRRFSVEEGLKTADFYTVIEDDIANLWMACKRGLFFLNRGELDRFDAGTISKLHPVDYTELRRLQMPRFTRFGFPLTEKMSDGRLCFPTTKGVAIVDPQRIPYNRVAPTVLVEKVVLDHRTELKGGPFEIPPGTRDIRIEFTAASLRSPEYIRFQYRLAGFQTDWVEAKQSRAAFYQNLGPGNYSFEVRAANEDGVWSEEGASVLLNIQPMFHQTAMFKVLGIALTVGAGWAAVRSRARQQNRKIAAMIEERTRIARELHDTLEQGLVGVSMQLNLAANLASKQSFPGRKYLDRARYMLKHSMADARAAILDLRKERLPKNLFAELRRIAQEMTEDHGIGLECVQRGTPGNLSSFFVTTLLRIGQEAITNIVKHARPTQVAIELAHGPGEVTLTIEDDGRGFDPSALPALEDEHFGLLGARERTEKLGGILQVESFPGEGTRIVVRLPLNRRSALHEDVDPAQAETLTHG